MEPWDAERTDLAAGELVTTTLAAHGIKPKEPAAYMPYLKKKMPKPQTERETRVIVEGINAALSREG